MQEQIAPQQQLVNAREQAKWSVEQVANALNLPSYCIQLLEAGEFSKLHGSVYAISYIKAYAALFSLDGEALVEQYRQLIKQPNPQAEYIVPEAHAGTLSSSFEHKKHRTLYGILAAFALIAVVGILMAGPSDSNTQRLDMLSEAIVVDTVVGTTTIESLDILAGKDPTAAVIASRSDEKTPAKTTEAMVQQHIEQQSQAVSELSFQFSADCWVEVLDGDNQKIFSSLQKAQERLVLEGKPPFHVTLGYAPGVSLSYNGEPIEIDAKNAKFKKLVLGNS